jgi:hypothetical protein
MNSICVSEEHGGPPRGGQIENEKGTNVKAHADLATKTFISPCQMTPWRGDRRHGRNHNNDAGPKSVRPCGI